MNELIHNHIRGDSAVKIAESIENGIRDRKLQSGQKLPTVRRLADHLDVAPGTVAAAYRLLQSRGVVVAQGRRGTRISHRPVFGPQPCRPCTGDARDLYDGNPDPNLLPDFSKILDHIDTTHHLYGREQHDPAFEQFMIESLRDDGVHVGEICVVNGAMDGIARVLDTHLRPGDRVIVEDPGFGNVFELVMSRGLSLIPVPVDDEGMRPQPFEAALHDGAQAVIVVPRAQNPLGAALTAERAATLREHLKSHPEVLIIEDDHMNVITDVPLNCLHDQSTPKWVHMRSVSKALNPDLRLAVMTGDEQSIHGILDRLMVGERWVSHILQRIAHAQLTDPDIQRALRQAAETYSARRNALVTALQRRGFDAFGASGFNVWIPVEEETATVQALLAEGWFVAAGERFRINAGPGIRITAATLTPEESETVADALGKASVRPPRTAAS